MNQRRKRYRRRRRNHLLQVLCIIVTLVATAGLIIGYRFSLKDDENGNSAVVNAAGSDHNLTPSISVTMSPTMSPIVSQTTTPTSAPTVTPTLIPEPTSSPTATPTITVDPKTEPTGSPQGDSEIDKASTQKMIALTFDDGPFPPVTERIVKTLAENDAKATFFVVGNRVEQYKSTLELVYEGGNQIASHTYSHKDLTNLSVKEIKEEINSANESINKIVPVGETYLRPPYGKKNDLMIKNVGVPMILWSLDTMDWSSKDANAVVKEIMDVVKDGDILIMHDLYPSTAEAMEIAIPKLIKEGYQLVTVQELLEAKGIDIIDGNVYYNGR